MSKALLGETLDIHMGGIEHIPVHHTNEIAQSESANNKPFVNYWLHNEHLMVNNGKMSKSEGTSYILADIKEKGFNPLALRYFFLQAHYRSKQNFTWESLEAAQTGYNRLINNISSLGTVVGEINTEFKQKFTEAISDDFSTPQALAIVHELLKSDIPNEDKLATILDFDKVLGLDIENTIQTSRFNLDVAIPENIQKLMDERKIARDNKDYKKADELRDQITALGFEVKDK
jgi:cysteinyl-tRNA synthetase